MINAICIVKFLITIGFVKIVQSSDDKCDINEFHRCVGQVSDFADGYSFHIASENQLQDSCRKKLLAVECVKDFVSKCMQRSEKEVFKATTGGKLNLVEELCTDGSSINRGYLENIGCWEKIVNDTQFCNAKFEQSQKILIQDDMIERLRMFHSCCAFDWHKKCKTMAAEIKCSHSASEYVDTVSTLLGGRVLSQLCGASSTSCYGLYGIEVEDLEERYSSVSSTRCSSGLPLYVLFMLGILSMFA